MTAPDRDQLQELCRALLNTARDIHDLIKEPSSSCTRRSLNTSQPDVSEKLMRRMTNLHERLQEAVNERLRIAEAATPGPWVYDSGLGMVVLIHNKDSLSVVASASVEDAAYIAANGPDRTIRECQRDLRVLERHVHRGHYASIQQCAVCKVPLPCPELLDLAEVYEIDAKGLQ
jgi:hypothetical protein